MRHLQGDFPFDVIVCLQLLRHCNRRSMSQRHVLGERNMTLLFDESFGLKPVVKVKLHFSKSLLQQFFVIYGFLTEFRREVLVLC